LIQKGDGHSPELNTQNGKKVADSSTMSPDHQVDEQLNLAVLSTFQLILKAFLDCLVTQN